jgi:alkyl sulfatase BDS1-like metallo-beta-lactamase superfamily hydrolase
VRLTDKRAFDRQGFIVDAAKGFIGTMEPRIVISKDSRVVWDYNDAYGFVWATVPTPRTRASGGRASRVPTEPLRLRCAVPVESQVEG